MKINRLFSIAAATMMMVACSSEDTALKNTPAAAPQMQFTATIAAPSSGTTRTEYTESGTDINVAWKVGDEIALIHGNVRDVATVKTINADGSATSTGFITKAENGDGVEVCYPAALWEWNDEAQGAIRNATFVTNINAQDGTLKYIQDNLDVRMAKGQLKVDGDNATLSASATLESQIAIWKLTLQDDAETPAALSATQVSVKVDGETPVTIASTEKLSTATSSVYLAMDAITNENLTILATVDEDTYSYVKEGVTLEAGKYYQSTVMMAKAATDLSKLTGDYTAKNGETLTGTLKENVKISIAAGATVTLDGVTITGEKNSRYTWAGITCEGDAIIILKDGTENTVNGFDKYYPGIHVPSEMTLTIKGTGKLTASSNGNGAGIGGGYNSINCGNIVIEGGVITANGGGSAAGIGSGSSTTCSSITISGGTITANGGEYAAGIGSGDSGSCGDILISGGTVSATGGTSGAGIGSGCDGSCGSIEITTDVTQVTATKDNRAPNSIGAGSGGSCGTVTIGGTVYWNGSAYENGGDTYLFKSTILYPVPAPIEQLSAVTSSQLGWIVGNDGKAYAVEPLPAGVDAVAMICYVGDNGEDAPYNHGLALALADEGEMDWSTAGTTCSGKNTSTPITGAKWLLASKDQWDYMINAAGGWSNLKDKAGLKSELYWSSSPGSDEGEAFAFKFYDGSWNTSVNKSYNGVNVRACLAF